MSIILSVLESLRNFARSIEAPKTRSAAETEHTAIHEAGHAALQIALGFGCSFVSIIPDLRRGSVGISIDGGLDSPEQNFGRRDGEILELQLAASEVFCLRRVMVCYAGAEAVRQLIPTDPDPDAGASRDQELAASYLISHTKRDAESINLLFSLARRRCAVLVAHYQPEILALARALKVRQMLTGKRAYKVFMKSLTGRSGRLVDVLSPYPVGRDWRIVDPPRWIH